MLVLLFIQQNKLKKQLIAKQQQQEKRQKKLKMQQMRKPLNQVQQLYQQEMKNTLLVAEQWQQAINLRAMAVCFLAVLSLQRDLT